MQTSGDMSGNGISVIIVNYGTADLTIEAVESVLARVHGGRSVEVHVVDNASPGDDAARLAEAHGARGWGDRVTLWPETENHGFGRGNNVVLTALAARATPPEYVFLLNPDARLENEAIDVLAKALDADAGIGAVGAGISDDDGQPATAAFRFPTMTSEIVRTIGFGPVDRAFAGRRVPLDPDHAGAVDWVSGAAVMFRMTALVEVGHFAPVFFLYFEEVDLMSRLARAGWRTVSAPEARVRHIEGAATSVRDDKIARRRRPAYLYESWRAFFARKYGRLYALTTAVLMVPGALCHYAIAGLRRKPPNLPAAYLRDHWRHVLRPLLTGASHG